MIVLLASNTLAWFIYATKVDTDVTIHVRAWNVVFEAGENEVSNIVNIPVSSIYPGMTDYEYDINAINDKFEELKKEMYMYNSYMLINNLALLDERQIKQIIADKYKLENINLSEEVLQVGNLEKTIEDIRALINYEYFKISGINVDDVELYMEYSKLIKE